MEYLYRNTKLDMEFISPWRKYKICLFVVSIMKYINFLKLYERNKSRFFCDMLKVEHVHEDVAFMTTN
jgi:hypothetical protein